MDEPAAPVFEPWPTSPPTAPVVVEPVSMPPWGPWSTIGWTLLAAIVATAVVSVLAIAVGILVAVTGVQNVDIAIQEHYGAVQLVSYVLMAAVMLAFLWLPIWARRRRFAEYVGLLPARAKQYAAAVGAILGFLAVEELLVFVLDRPVPESMIELWQTSDSTALLVLAVVVAAPLAEEIVFRGFLYRGLSVTRWGAGLAIVVTAATWAIVHVQYEWFEIGVIFVTGLLLGWFRHKTGSIKPGILMHAMMNGLSIGLFALWYE